MEYVKELEPTEEQKKFLRTVLEYDLTWTVDKTDTLKDMIKEASALIKKKASEEIEQ